MVTNHFWIFKSAISNELCNKIVHLGKQHLELLKKENINTKATVGDNRDISFSGETIPQNDITIQELKKLKIQKENTFIRDSDVVWLDFKWIYELINPFILEANFKAGWNFDMDYNEIPQFTSYSKNGFYGWHKDGLGDCLSATKNYVYGLTEVPLLNGRIPFGYSQNINLIGKVRKLSLTLNLTDPETYEGGNLKFYLGENSENSFIEVKEAREKGSIIVFPSFMDHCVTPVTKGTRYSLVNWVNGRPFK
jgi:PKHD-type hydroxylase